MGAGPLPDGALRFFVPGKPVPKYRPRAGQGHFYTPPATVEWERLVRFYALATAQQLGSHPVFQGPVGLNLCFFRDGVLIEVLPLPGEVGGGRGDLSNLVKSVEDALIGIMYRDDRQVVTLGARREGGLYERRERSA